MTADLVAFLRARLDEREREANAAAGAAGPDWYYDAEHGHVASRRQQDLVATGSQDHLDGERGAHIARHDPARVLRDVKAKRAILDHHFIQYWDPRKEGWVEECRCGEDMPCRTLRNLATVYDDHPDYQEAWRP